MIFSNENKQFLNDVLYRNYYLDFYKEHPKKKIDFIFPIKQDKNKNQLEINDNFNYNLIFKNLDLLLNWYNNSNFHCDINLKNIDNFIQEYSLDFFDLFLKIKNINLNIFTNLSFLNDFELTTKMISYIDKLEKNNIIIHFKIQLNGLYCDLINDEKFYQKVLDFISNYKNWEIFCEITPNNIQNWEQNYQWWVMQLNDLCFSHIHLTEINNNNWDLDSIQNFISFIDFQVDFLQEVLGENLKTFIFNQFDSPIFFTNIQLINKEIINNHQYYRHCGFHDNLSIDLSNLKLILCEKLNYKNFSIGHFDATEWEPEIVELSMLKTHLKRSSTPHCEKCQFIELCPGFCYADSFNYIYNPLIPIRQYCNLITAKYNFLIYKYITMGLFDFSDINIPEYFKKYLMTVISNISSNLNLGDEK